MNASQQYLNWMRDSALPFWADRGFDRTRGRFEERLNRNGVPMDVPYRSMVQARQIYVFSSACRGGWFPEGGVLAETAMASLLRDFAVQNCGETGFHFSINRDGTPVSRVCDAYAHAFILFAIASLHALNGDQKLITLAESVNAFVKSTLLDTKCGGVFDAFPRAHEDKRQNPQMHLLEAYLALERTMPSEGYLADASTLITLFESRMFDSQLGVLREYFTRDWSTHPDSAKDDIVEPGHHFEWVWLLREYELLSGRDMSACSERLYQRAVAHGIAPDGLLYDELQSDMSVIKTSHRVWPHTEAIKAASVRHAAGDADAGLIADEMAHGLLHNFLDQPFQGGWIDHISTQYQPLVDYVPASTLYHLYFAASELNKHLFAADSAVVSEPERSFMMQAALDPFDGVHVAVIGDVMLDCYLYGDVHRISPEAPVPVIRATSEKAVPGGAANVAANLASLGVHAHMVAVSGDDPARYDLVASLSRSGNVDCSGIIATSTRRTTKKLRIIGANQQMVRIDHEDVAECDDALQSACIGAALKSIDAAHVVILSDYGKGMCSLPVTAAVIEHARANGKQVLVDPKRRDFSAYKGASILTPNRKELADATGMPCETDEQAQAAAKVAQAVCFADILLTRSEKGMSYFPMDGAPIHLPTVAQDVFDVSGAGDTVVAVLAAALGAGLPIVDAMRLANHAAGIVVSKMGTATITRDELQAALAAEDTVAVHDGRLLNEDQAIAMRWSWARNRLTVGMAAGSFDMLQPDHCASIQQAATRCDRLVVALYSDKLVQRLRGPGLPVQHQQVRAAIVGALKGVAAVVVSDDASLTSLVSVLQPDVLIGELTDRRFVSTSFGRAPDASRTRLTR